MQYISKYSASFWGQSFVKEMTKINAGVPGTLGAAAHEEAATADIAGKTQLFKNGTTTPPSEALNGHAPPNGKPNGTAGDDKDKSTTTQHTIVGKTYEHAKEMVQNAKEAISQGEPHVAFSASS